MPKPKKRKSLGERLLEARTKLGYSRDTVARMASIPYVTYLSIETDGTNNPKIRNVVSIARVLGLSLDDLVQDMFLEEKELSIPNLKPKKLGK